MRDSAGHKEIYQATAQGHLQWPAINIFKGMKVATPSLPAYPQMGLGGEAKLPAAKCGKQPNPYLSCGGVGREGGGRWLLLQVGSQPLPPHLYLISEDSPVPPVPGPDPRQGSISPPSPKQRATKERHSKRPWSAVTETLFSRERLRKWFEQPYYKIKMYPPTPWKEIRERQARKKSSKKKCAKGLERKGC